MGERRGVAGVVELPHHLLVGQLAPGVLAGKVEEPPQEGRFVDARHEEDVAGHRGLNDGVEEVGPPAFDVVDERCGAGIAPEEDERVEVEAEGIPALRPRPVRHRDRFEAPGQAFGEPPLHQQRRGAAQQNPHVTAGERILVPEPLDPGRPARDLLDLVHCQHHRASGLRLDLPRASPLFLEPGRRLQRRRVRGNVMPRELDRREDLSD